MASPSNAPASVTDDNRLPDDGTAASLVSIATTSDAPTLLQSNMTSQRATGQQFAEGDSSISNNESNISEVFDSMLTNPSSDSHSSSTHPVKKWQPDRPDRQPTVNEATGSEEEDVDGEEKKFDPTSTQNVATEADVVPKDMEAGEGLDNNRMSRQGINDRRRIDQMTRVLCGSSVAVGILGVALLVLAGVCGFSNVC